jgi:hypothetical protein
MSSLKDSQCASHSYLGFLLHKTLAWRQTCHVVVILRPKDQLLPRLNVIHCRLQTNPLQCMHLWMCRALCHPLSTNTRRMWHFWRSSAAFANNNIHLMLGVHNTCNQWQSLSCALSITSTFNSTPITKGIDRT